MPLRKTNFSLFFEHGFLSFWGWRSNFFLIASKYLKLQFDTKQLKPNYPFLCKYFLSVRFSFISLIWSTAYFSEKSTKAKIDLVLKKGSSKIGLYIITLAPNNLKYTKLCNLTINYLWISSCSLCLIIPTWAGKLLARF